MVPLAIMSPLRMLHPFTVWWANCWAMLQYRYLVLLRHHGLPGMLRCYGDLQVDVEDCEGFLMQVKAGGVGSCRATGGTVPAHQGHRQVLMLLAKFLARKGPSGTYSQVCMSRAQSLKSTSPKMCSSASSG